MIFDGYFWLMDEAKKMIKRDKQIFTKKGKNMDIIEHMKFEINSLQFKDLDIGDVYRLRGEVNNIFMKIEPIESNQYFGNALDFRNNIIVECAPVSKVKKLKAELKIYGEME